MFSTEMQVHALRVIKGYDFDRAVSWKYARRAMALPLSKLNRTEAKHATYLMAHCLYLGDIDAFNESMLYSDKRMRLTWVGVGVGLKEELLERARMLKVRRCQQEQDLQFAISVKKAWNEEVRAAERNVCQAMRYTSLHDWNWVQATNSFNLTVRDKAENFHNFVIFDGTDIKTVWRWVAGEGYAEVGRWIGDDEELGL